jgi:hypothetical protein
MRLPETFNSNEWFIIAVCIILITLSLLLKRSFLFSQIIVIFTVNFFLAASLDHILAGPPYDLYDIMDMPDFEIFDFIMYLLVYPLSGYLFIRFLSIFIEKGFPVIVFLFLSTITTVGLEWVSVQFHVYEHLNWTYFYSFISYMVIFCINIALYFWFVNENNSIHTSAKS